MLFQKPVRKKSYLFMYYFHGHEIEFVSYYLHRIHEQM